MDINDFNDRVARLEGKVIVLEEQIAGIRATEDRLLKGIDKRLERIEKRNAKQGKIILGCLIAIFTLLVAMYNTNPELATSVATTLGKTAVL